MAGRAQEEWDKFFEKEDAFQAVQNKDHWKGPIDAVIDADKRKITTEAISFFAGGKGIKFTDAGDGRLRVTAPGYWANGF